MALAKRSSAVVLGGGVALWGLYGIATHVRSLEAARSMSHVERLAHGNAAASVAKPTRRPSAGETLTRADRKVEQAENPGLTALCSAALFCDAHGLYLRARTALNADPACDEACARRAGVEARVGYVDKRLAELRKERPAARYAARAKSIAACAGDPESCNCIDALAKLYCE